jgi:hypothetical protein
MKYAPTPTITISITPDEHDVLIWSLDSYSGNTGDKTALRMVRKLEYLKRNNAAGACQSTSRQPAAKGEVDSSSLAGVSVGDTHSTCTVCAGTRRASFIDAPCPACQGTGVDISINETCLDCVGSVKFQPALQTCTKGLLRECSNCSHICYGFCTYGGNHV